MSQKTLSIKQPKQKMLIAPPLTIGRSATPKTLLVRSSFAQSLPEFDDHRLLTFMHDPISGLRSFVAIHRGGIVAPAFGATRFLHYATEDSAARDALRLARTMSYKSAMAGLPYGGAKGVIIAPFRHITSAKKNQILQQYARHLNYFRGAFITGTDVGINRSELDAMHKNTPHLVGFRVSPEDYTAVGVVEAIKSTLHAITGSSAVKGRSFAIQGLGKVGSRVGKILADLGATLIVADVDPLAVSLFKKHHPAASVMPAKDIHKAPVDIFVPCALYGVLNEKTVPQLNCSAVVGAANNQLARPEIVTSMARRGIMYIPDYVVNAGGLISVAEEYGNEKLSRGGLDTLISKKVMEIGGTVDRIISQAKKEKKTPFHIANAVAESIFNKII